MFWDDVMLEIMFLTEELAFPVLQCDEPCSRSNRWRCFLLEGLENVRLALGLLSVREEGL